MTIHLAGNLSATDRVIHEADHLAALAEKDKEIVSIKGMIEAHVRNNRDKNEQIAALQEEINNPKKTYCAWCGFTVEIDDDAGSGIAEHVDTCEKHPLNRKIAALQARIKELTEALEMLSGHDDRFVRETSKAALTAQKEGSDAHRNGRN